MTQINPNIHYVRFMRGSISAWEALKATPERINDDTLYFIYDNAETSTNGKLYLGQKLISNSEEESINIKDLENIYIDEETLADKQLLVYNETNQTWENASLSQIINTAIGIMEGASTERAGKGGLVPQPKVGDQNKFLKGNGTWATINIPTFNSDLFTTINENEITINGFISAPVGTIPKKTSNGIEWITPKSLEISREITTLEDLQQAVENGTTNSNTIYMIPNNSTSNSSNRYDEYIIVQQKIEYLGVCKEDIDYVTTSDFQTAISNLNDILNDTVDNSTGNLIPGLITQVNTIKDNYITKESIGDLSSLILNDDNTNLVEEVNSINKTVNNLSNRLQWHELNYNN